MYGKYNPVIVYVYPSTQENIFCSVDFSFLRNIYSTTEKYEATTFEYLVEYILKSNPA